MRLYRIRDELYEPSTSTDLVYDIGSIFSTIYQNEDMKIKSYVATVIK